MWALSVAAARRPSSCVVGAPRQRDSGGRGEGASRDLAARARPVVEVHDEIGEPDGGEPVQHCVDRGALLCHEQHALSPGDSVAIRFAIVWLLPVPGGPGHKTTARHARR